MPCLKCLHTSYSWQEFNLCITAIETETHLLPCWRQQALKLVKMSYGSIIETDGLKGHYKHVKHHIMQINILLWGFLKYLLTNHQPIFKTAYSNIDWGFPLAVFIRSVENLLYERSYCLEIYGNIENWHEKLFEHWLMPHFHN